VFNQLIIKIQHAFRCSRAKYWRGICKAVEKYSISTFYNIPELIELLDVGKTLIAVLNERRIPVRLAHIYFVVPSFNRKVLFESEWATLDMRFYWY